MVSNINLGSVQAPYWEQTIVLKPHERRKIEYATDNFQLISSSLPNALRVNFGGSMIDTPFRAGMGYRLTDPVQFVEIWNDNDVELTVDFALGIGQIQDNRLNVSGQIDTITTTRGFSNYTAMSKTGVSSTAYPSNSQIDVICTSETITLNNNNGISNLILAAGMAFSVCLAQSGTLSISGTGSYNISIGSY